MRAVPILAVVATLALGAVSALPAQAQGLVQVSPPAESAAPIETPIFEDVKVEVGTALPPKAGSAVLFNGGPTEWRLPLKSRRATTEPSKPNR